MAELADSGARGVVLSNERSGAGEPSESALPSAELESVLDALTDGFAAVDGAWRLVSLNKAAEAWLGLDRTRALGLDLWQALPQLRGTPIEEAYRRTMDTRRSEDFVLPAVLQPGRYLEVHAFPLKTGVGVTFRDVTERVAVMEQLQRGGAEVRQLMDALPVSVSYVDRDERFQFNNLAYERWSERQREELKGQRVQDVIGEANYARVKAYIDRVQAGERVTFEWEGRRLSKGEPGFYRSDYIPRLNEAGSPDGFYVLFTDITDSKRVEAHLQTINEGLEQAVATRTAELTEALQELRNEAAERERAEEALRQAQKLEALGQLTGGVAHDFNNLLTVIQSSTDLLRRAGDNPERRERYIAAIAQASERAAALTSQLLSFARRQPMQRSCFDVRARLAGLSTLIGSTLGARYELMVEADDCPLVVETDPNQFDTAVLNVVLNARDAMADGGALAISARQEGDSVALRIHDDGPGIPPDVLERVFEPFFTTKAVGRGTGLGLSQVYGFAQQSGGDISIDSCVGRGTTVTLRLPRTVAATVEPAPAPERVERGRGGGRALLVEDNALVAEFAGRLLDELGWGWTRVCDGAAALEEVRANPASYKVVLSDVVMPGELSGVDLANALRDELPHLPVILTSGYSHVLAQEGSFGFPLLQKPYRLQQLAALLGEVEASVAVEACP